MFWGLGTKMDSVVSRTPEGRIGMDVGLHSVVTSWTGDMMESFSSTPLSRIRNVHLFYNNQYIQVTDVWNAEQLVCFSYTSKYSRR